MGRIEYGAPRVVVGPLKTEHREPEPRTSEPAVSTDADGVNNLVQPLPGERERVSTVAARWRQQYPDDNYAFSHAFGNETLKRKTAGEIYRELLALSPDATVEDVACIMGNASGWIGHYCRLCGEYKTLAIQIGDEPDYDSDTIVVCCDCSVRVANRILELVQLFGEAQSAPSRVGKSEPVDPDR